MEQLPKSRRRGPIEHTVSRVCLLACYSYQVNPSLGSSEEAVSETGDGPHAAAMAGSHISREVLAIPEGVLKQV